MTRILKDQPWVLGVLVLVVAGAGFGVWSLMTTEAHEWNGAVYSPPRPGIDFTLTDVEGEPMSLEELRGKPVLLYFGYTYCPDFCPSTLVEFRRVKEMLGDRADDVAFMMISVDPARDTPERMEEYLASFDPEFIGLTGAEEELTPVMQEFGIFAVPGEATPEAGGAYLVDHSISTYLLNQDGELLLQYAWGTSADDMYEDVRHLLDA